MAKSLFQIKSSVQNLLRGGFGVDDDRIDDKLVEDKIHDVRSRLIEEYYLSHGTLDDSFYQEKCCIEVECVDLKCEGISSGVKVWQLTLPKLAVIGGKTFLKFLGTIDKKNKFTNKSILGQVYREGDIYTPNTVTTYTRIGETVTVDNPPTQGFTYACAVGIFDNPVNALCDPKSDVDYPLPLTLIESLELRVVETLTIMLSKDPEEQNNAMDDLRFVGSGRKKDNSNQ